MIELPSTRNLSCRAGTLTTMAAWLYLVAMDASFPYCPTVSQCIPTIDLNLLPGVRFPAASLEDA